MALRRKAAKSLCHENVFYFCTFLSETLFFFIFCLFFVIFIHFSSFSFLQIFRYFFQQGWLDSLKMRISQNYNFDITRDAQVLETCTVHRWGSISPFLLITLSEYPPLLKILHPLFFLDFFFNYLCHTTMKCIFTIRKSPPLSNSAGYDKNWAIFPFLLIRPFWPSPPL